MTEPEPPKFAEELWEMKKELDRKKEQNYGSYHEINTEVI
jgi:hypothetical protein